MKHLIKNKKTAVSVLVFLIAASALLGYLTSIFDLNDDKHAERTFASFYSLEKNSLDGIYLGSSAAYRYWIPTQAYTRYGMKIFNLSTGSQPVVLQKYLIKEALKSQPDMKVIVIDIRSIIAADKKLKESDIRRVTDSMPMSANRIRAINAALKYFKQEGADISYSKRNYYFSYLLYHNRWADDFSVSDLNPVDKKNPYMGFIYTSGSSQSNTLTPPEYTSETSGLDSAKTAVLKDLLAYCKTLKQKVIFVSSPYQISSADQKDLNTCEKMIEKSGFTFLDFNTEKLSDKMNLNWTTDFLDSKHVNYSGAEKFTAYMSAYLNKQITFDKQTSSASAKEWKQAAKRLDRAVSDSQQLQ